jgi:hypothetical protein
MLSNCLVGDQRRTGKGQCCGGQRSIYVFQPPWAAMSTRHLERFAVPCAIDKQVRVTESAVAVEMFLNRIPSAYV